MNKYWWLIPLLLVVGQIVGSLREKKAKQERMGKAAEHRLRQGQAAGLAERGSAGTETQQRRTGASASPAPSRQDRLQDLRQRRQAQLDELRKRTAARKGVSRGGPSAGAVVRSGQTASRPAAPQRARPSGPSARPGKGPGALRTSAVAKVPTRQTPSQRPTAVPPPIPQTGEQQRAEERHSHRTMVSERSSTPAREQPYGSAGKPVTISAENLTAQELRRIVVLREIFDPPIALREDGDVSNRF